jgi:hypothetical protein
MSLFAKAHVAPLSAIVLTLAGSALPSAPAQAATLAATGAGATNCISDCSTIYINQSLAGRFTLASASAISGVEGWLAAGATQSIGITIWSGANKPTEMLYQGSFTFNVTNNTYYQSSWAGLSGVDWTLDAGDYWVSFSSSNPGNNAPVMSRAVGGQAAAYSIYHPGEGWSAAYGQGGGSSVSFPAMGFRIFGEALASDVPEPASWAMMLGGFGLIGGAMRSRRRTRVSFG